MKRLPITRKILLDELDNREMIRGYMDGFKNRPEPGPDASYSYWHGWRNGMVDGGFREKDDAQAQLAHDVFISQKRKDSKGYRKGR